MSVSPTARSNVHLEQKHRLSVKRRFQTLQLCKRHRVSPNVSPMEHTKKDHWISVVFPKGFTPNEQSKNAVSGLWMVEHTQSLVNQHSCFLCTIHTTGLHGLRTDEQPTTAQKVRRNEYKSERARHHTKTETQPRTTDVHRPDFTHTHA